MISNPKFVLYRYTLIFLNDMFMSYLKSHPHTPGRYPGCFTNSLFPGFPFFVGKLGEVWGIPSSQGPALWAKSLRFITPLTIKDPSTTFLRQQIPIPKTQPFGKKSDPSIHRSVRQRALELELQLEHLNCKGIFLLSC